MDKIQVKSTALYKNYKDLSGELSVVLRNYCEMVNYYATIVLYKLLEIKMKRRNSSL